MGTVLASVNPCESEGMEAIAEVYKESMAVRDVLGGLDDDCGGSSGSLVGEDGKSAYEIAVENGFVGDVTEWLASLKGAYGKSAYDVAVANGFVGTVAQWVASLEGAKGDKGDTGAKGADGAVPSIINGKWNVNGIDTGISATGPKGADGANGLKGDPGATPTIVNGKWNVGGVDTGISATGPKGADGATGTAGKNGADGNTPYIQDGTWWIGTTNTGINATGPKGDQGDQGIQGPKGADGSSMDIQQGEYRQPGSVKDLPDLPAFADTTERQAYIVDDDDIDGQYDLYFHGVGATDWQVIDNWAGVPGPQGEEGPEGKQGPKGDTPYIQNGVWYVSGVSTGIAAQGPKGDNGADGENGEQGPKGDPGAAPTIVGGVWYINGVSTGINATGPKGADGVPGAAGEDGNTPYIQNGIWYINGIDTGFPATGPKGDAADLTPDQLAALNSTITYEKVEQYDAALGGGHTTIISKYVLSSDIPSSEVIQLDSAEGVTLTIQHSGIDSSAYKPTLTISSNAAGVRYYLSGMLRGMSSSLFQQGFNKVFAVTTNNAISYDGYLEWDMIAVGDTDTAPIYNVKIQVRRSSTLPWTLLYVTEVTKIPIQ